MAEKSIPAGETLDMIVPGLRALAVPIDRLRTMQGNPHHGDIEALTRSWKRFGQRRPLIGRQDADNESGEIIAGNHGLEVARRLKWSHVAVLWVNDDDATAKAFAVADNRTAQLGYEDPELLTDLLMDIRMSDTDLFAATAYDTSDLAKLLDPSLGLQVRKGNKQDAADQLVEQSWAVIVNVDNEEAQLELLERLTAEGFSCRALIS
jgi:ParB-like chromosome segregation protein Spo0J